MHQLSGLVINNKMAWTCGNYWILTYEGSNKLRKPPPAWGIIGESGGMDKDETVLSTVGNSMIITVGQFCTDDENNK